MSAMEGNSRSGNILRLPQVRLRTGLSKSTIYELEAKGAFPHRIRLTERAVGWVEAEIQEWSATRPKIKPGT
jgi:prophage regulatory protein